MICLGYVLVCGTYLRIGLSALATAPALLASSGIRPTKAKACLVLLAWFVPIVPTLMMCDGLVPRQV